MADLKSYEVEAMTCDLPTSEVTHMSRRQIAAISYVGVVQLVEYLASISDKNGEMIYCAEDVSKLTQEQLANECRAAFEVYDTTGEGKIDAFYIAPLLRALDVCITNETAKKAGATKKEGEKMITFDEFLPIFSDCRKSKDMGQIEDLLEGLKVYDKNENGTMMAAELAHVLLSLGEKLQDAEVDEIFTACCPPEDEDGYVKYETLLKNIFAGPFPAEEPPK